MTLTMDLIIPKTVRKMYKESGYTEQEMQATEKKVYADFPMTKKEKEGCQTEKARQDTLRKLRRERYISKRNYDYGAVPAGEPKV
jgi:hypothetical protein